MKKSELSQIPEIITINWEEVQRQLAEGEGYKGPPISVTLNLKDLQENNPEAEKCVMIVPQPPKRRKKPTR